MKDECSATTYHFFDVCPSTSSEQRPNIDLQLVDMVFLSYLKH